ncbi:hypothetical protein BUALT_Bualt10G0046200 [Buddleja alternifolia]|uniref:Reverse transcriptase/retrotransposon-derived protein RNase H-like domain-containing protein n=1 Tax=Buddleja alternifolia TaxID=168488 RepID=A0AAV6WW27_9LAMI|nr:hypothetical protein BUALT_Bualt10G0046200 [Buddleja alternifolia]
MVRRLSEAPGRARKAVTKQLSDIYPNALRDRILEMEMRIFWVEGFMGTPPKLLETTVFQALEKIDALQKSVNEIPSFIEGRIMSMGEDLGMLTDVVDLKIDVINTELSVLKRAMGGSMPNERPSSSKLKVPDLKPFCGARDAKELENFLWDMETYFQAAKISDLEKVSITNMYLASDAKLWWRTHISANRYKIEKWDALKHELKDHFLMMDIHEMAEEDKLFNFMSGLQSWAQAELRRQGVKDLSSTYAATDRLVDFHVIGGPDSEKKQSKDMGKDKGKNKYGKDGKSKFKKAKDAASGSKPKESQPEIDKSRKGCFICGGDHRMRDCPKRSKLNALMAEDDDSGKDVAPSWVNPLQLLSAIQGKSPNHKGLMYVKITVNGKVVMEMIDTGATHNFVAEREIQKLGLNVSEHSSRIKVVNSEAKPIKGMATVHLVIGSWHGQCELMAVPLDDFDIILGMQFLISSNAFVCPCVGGLLFVDAECNPFVKDVFPSDDPGPSNNKNGCLSAMQVKKGLKHGELTYLAAMVEIKKDVFQEMDGKKVLAVAEWTAPSKVADLRSFLGLANYYRRFIKGYSKIVNPLTDLLKKDQKWEWTVKCQSAFDLLKQAVSSEPVLKMPEFDKPFEVQTDASDRAIGGVLVQDKHPIAFESRRLKDAKMRYSTHEKEMTGVIHCLDAWKHYLLGTKFTVVTDNVANTYLKTQKKLTPKQALWQEFLGEYDFDWVHKPGKHNDVADALSQKVVEEYVAALTLVESDFLERI